MPYVFRMGTMLTVTTKGQVTLKKEILDHLGIAPGDKIEVDRVAPGRVEVRPARSASGLEGFIGCLARPGTRKLTLAEIDEATHEGWAHGGDPEN